MTLTRAYCNLTHLDPQLLRQIRAHTLEIQGVRERWNKPSSFRDWNAEAKSPEPPPLAIKSYRSAQERLLS